VRTEGVALAALVLACGGSSKPPADPPAPGVSGVGLHAPVDFAFDSLDDRPVSSEATRGLPTVMTFVTTGSLPSQAQVDFLVVMAGHDEGKVNYAVVALDGADSRELVELYGKSLHVTFPVAMADDSSRTGGGPFGDVTNVPVTVVMDRLGRVVWRSEGKVAKADELRRAMKGL
jgi:hypothetical protein